MASLPYEKMESFPFFQPLPNLGEFHYLPPKIQTQILMAPIAEKAYPELLDDLKKSPTLINEWKLFEVDANGLHGFGMIVKNLFKSIAQTVRGFHKSDCYYGNLFDRVSIRIPQLIPIFPYNPQKTRTEAQLVNGIKNDIENFRWMVSYFLLAGGVELNKLSTDFELFFSKIFTRAMGGDLEEIRAFAVYQMFHPVFFDGEDRLRFFLQVIFYRSRIKNNNFDQGLTYLYNYKVDEYWEEKIDNDKKIDNDIELDKRVLTYILNSTKPNNKGVDPYKHIPRFIRNVHIHYHDYYYDEQKIPNYDRMLNILFPGICSKMLDCIIRYIDERYWKIVRFSTMLEQYPVFQSMERRVFGPSRGGGSGCAGAEAGGGKGADSGTGAGSSSSGVGWRPYHTGSSSSGSGGRPSGDGGGRGGRVAYSDTGSNVSGVGPPTHHTGSRSSGSGSRTGGDGGGRGGSSDRSLHSNNPFTLLSDKGDEDK